MVDEVLKQRIKLTPGGRELVATMRAHGAYTCLISGGFTLFTNAVAAMIGFQENRANELKVADGKLTGEVAEPILGRAAKLATLVELREAFDLDNLDTLVVGDGANDLGMIEAAGLGVAYHAKPAVAAAAAARIDHGDLTALLYAQGYRREEFVGGYARCRPCCAGTLARSSIPTARPTASFMCVLEISRPNSDCTTSLSLLTRISCARNRRYSASGPWHDLPESKWHEHLEIDVSDIRLVSVPLPPTNGGDVADGAGSQLP